MFSTSYGIQLVAKDRERDLLRQSETRTFTQRLFSALLGRYSR
ncbi:MAG: hypothetical protein AAF485_21695 [Chloroflexota bacterium]